MSGAAHISDLGDITAFCTTPLSPHDMAKTARLAYEIADRNVIADIETHAAAASRTPQGRKRYDLRPMLDEREHAFQAIDIARQAVAYAFWRGLVVSSGHHPLIVVITQLEAL